MNDIGRMLRDEAGRIPAAVPPGLAPRIRAALAAAPVPAPAEPRSGPWLPLAAAAALVAAGLLAWQAGRQAPAAPTATAALVAVPAPLGISDLMQAASAAGRQAPRHDEIGALGSDLAAAARTVRGAIPF